MGVRLIKFDRYGNTNNYSYDHDDLINRDMMNQHPIYAIIGLQEVLNILEDSIHDINQYLIDHTTDNIEKNIDDIEDSIEDLYKQIRTHIIQDVKDTYSIDMDYDKNTQTLKSDVRIFKNENYDNAIQVLADGLFVPSIITKNTNTVLWTKTTPGYTLKQLFDTGHKYSHYIASWTDSYEPAIENNWYYDSSKQSFVMPDNSPVVHGIVTQEYYDYYTHDCFLNSDNGDNDIIGVVIGHIVDENGNPHTLTVAFDREGLNVNYGLWYDYRLPDQYCILNQGNVSFGTIPGGTQVGAWDTSGGINVQVLKEHNIIEVVASDWGGNVYNENTRMRIDLNNYSWGHYFIGPVRYGYMCFSQALSWYRTINFEARNNPSKYIFSADIKVSKDAQNEIIVKSDGIFAPKFNISAGSGNALEKRSDGYYVCAAISKASDNALEKRSDGLYTRDYRNIRIVNKTNHGFVVGDFIYYHPSSGYQKAKAIDYYDINIVGMVTKVISVNQFEYQWSGYFPTTLFNTSNGYTQGMPLYISDKTAGKVVQKQPDISKAVGYPVENNGLIISIERGIQYNQESKIGDMKSSANDFNVRSDGFIKVALDIDYKNSLIERLLNTLSDEFKEHYMIIGDTTSQFINLDELYNAQRVPFGMNLFIKAF